MNPMCIVTRLKDGQVVHVDPRKDRQALTPEQMGVLRSSGFEVVVRTYNTFNEPAPTAKDFQNTYGVESPHPEDGLDHCGG